MQFIAEHEDDINDKKTLLKYAALCAVPLALIIAEPNLSTTICTALVLCLLIYIGGLSYKFIGTVLVILIPTASSFWLSLSSQTSRFFRIISRNGSWSSWSRKICGQRSYQQRNSVMAIGSGQLTGKGLNNNTTDSVKNGDFILEPSTDLSSLLSAKNLASSEAVLLLLYYY